METLNSLKRFNKKSVLLFFIFFISLTFDLSASHIIGGNIAYRWVNNNDYKVSITLYRDCTGISSGPSISFTMESISCSYTAVISGIPLISFTSITPICANSVNQSSCVSGSLFAIQKSVYEGLVTLPFTCSDWEFYLTICCRSSSITNLQNAGSGSMYINARLNNLDVSYNNSSVFIADPLHIIFNNSNTNIVNTAYDVEGDSLTYELAPVLDINQGLPVPLIYSTGYNYQQPFMSSAPSVLDSNGVLNITPNTVQNSMVKIIIKEYRSGFLIGETSREYPVLVINGANNLPSISGINGSNSFNISGCVGDTIQFDVFTNDIDSGQNLSIGMIGPLTNAVMNISVGQNPTGTFTWIPSANYISAFPYIFSISVSDDYCDYKGIQNKLFYVYVNSCNTNDVWPGDVNADGVANVYDLLPLATALGNSGPVRPSASLNWTAQLAPNWNTSFINTINYKHADTNGDGDVTLSDTLAIAQNYGLTHPLKIQNPQSQNTSILNINSNFNTVTPSTEITFDIILTSPVDSISGIAFSIFFDPQLVDMNSIKIDYTGSTLGILNLDMIKMDKTILNNGIAEIAIAKSDHSNFNGSGLLVQLKATTKSVISNASTLLVEATGITANNSIGVDVNINSVGTIVNVLPNFVGLNDKIDEIPLNIFPIPSNGNFIISLSGDKVFETLKIFNSQSKEVFNSIEKLNQIHIDLSSLAKGVYFVKSVVNQKEYVKKIVIL